MVRRVIGEHIELAMETGTALRPVLADPGQIEQVIMNLCVNARDAMPNGGRISIALANVALDESFAGENPWARAGDFVRMTVADTGTGMDEHVRAHIFEPFFTTKRVGEGSGLGLATVYGIVKQHDGLIDVESEPGAGTAFHIFLPVADEKEAAAAAQSEAPRPASADDSGRRTILMAEDDEMVRNIGRKVLERGGYRLILAADGREAARLFDEHAGEIDLAVLDVVMPGMNGKAVADHIKTLRPDMPVLFCSGYDFKMLEANLSTGEAAALIHKPYNPMDLLKRVAEAMKQ